MVKYVIGIDEVGRGPLAGPVTLCAVLCEEKWYKKLKRSKQLPPLGKDSKKLSPEARQKYSKYLETLMSRTFLAISIVHISNKEIDKIGIAKCIRKAIENCLKNLILKNYLKIKNLKLKIVLDGGLKVPEGFIKKYPNIRFSQTTIIKGDEKEKIIAWASILAKVSRDELMVKAHKKFPQYNFHLHKGYGTLAHRAAISTHGISLIHRKTFCKNIV